MHLYTGFSAATVSLFTVDAAATPVLSPGDRYGEISVDTEKSHRVFKEWLAKTRSPVEHSPDGNRRPLWLVRPVKPVAAAYKLPTTTG